MGWKEGGGVGTGSHAEVLCVYKGEGAHGTFMDPNDTNKAGAQRRDVHMFDFFIFLILFCFFKKNHILILKAAGPCEHLTAIKGFLEVLSKAVSLRFPESGQPGGGGPNPSSRCPGTEPRAHPARP